MNNYQNFFNYISHLPIAEHLRSETEKVVSNINHGDYDKWQKAYNNLPCVEPSMINLESSVITIGTSQDINNQTEDLTETLKTFHPWRKGPFELFGVAIDTEWRSDLKWDRIVPHLPDLSGKSILDIGCGNGYHCLRIAAHNPRAVIGVDPFLLYVMQFEVINRFAGCENVALLPLGIENLPHDCPCMDIVLSMGVLYHRREPMEHLRHIKKLLAPNGTAVVETLIIDTPENNVLKPSGRYAKMRNVFEIPSPSTLIRWLEQTGFNDIEIVDITPTTTQEQRKTGWMIFESLEDFLDPSDRSKTIEGYPAPVRAIVICKN